jgi:hypothetical protein
MLVDRKGAGRLARRNVLGDPVSCDRRLSAFQVRHPRAERFNLPLLLLHLVQ